MSDKGYRSVSVQIVNDGWEDMEVAAVAASANASWIGPAPTSGEPLAQYAMKTWGVMTDATDGNVSGMMSFMSKGSAYPLSISFTNSNIGESTCTATHNNLYKAAITQVDTKSMNHSMFNLVILAIGG